MSVTKQARRVESLAAFAARYRIRFEREQRRVDNLKDHALRDPLVTTSWSFAAGVWFTLPRSNSLADHARALVDAIGTMRIAARILQMRNASSTRARTLP